MATATKVTAVALRHDRLLLVGAPLTLENARLLVGRQIDMPTRTALETASFAVEQVTQNRETGDIMAWVVRDGGSGHHARIVAQQ